jgi:branched-chain amino acid transport system substrate-binding protein
MVRNGRWDRCPALAGLLVATVLGTALCPCLVEAADDIRIGYTPSLSGIRAKQGANELKATQLAVKQINAVGGINGRRISLVIADNQSTLAGARAAVQKLVEQEHVVALISFIISAQVLEVSEAIRSYGIPTMIGGTNVTLTHRGNPWFFRMRQDDSIAAFAMIKYIDEDLKLRKVGILHDRDAFGSGGADLLEKSAKERGLVIVGRENYASGEKNYMAQLEALKAAGAEIIVVYSHEGEAGWIERQYRELGSPYKYLGSPGSQTKSTLEISKDAAEGLLAIADLVPGQIAYKQYADAFRREYGEECDATSSWTYDAVHILAGAIRNAGDDRAKIRETILAVKDYQGVLGTFAFTPNGDGLHEVSVVQIEGGQPKLIKSIQLDTN